MMTEEQIRIANALLATGLVKEVFHSVSILEDKEGAKYPVYAVGTEEMEIGPNDRKERFAYIRQTGSVMKLKEELEGSERRIYLLAAPCRVVVFKDHETENVEYLIKRLLAVAFVENVSLVSYQHDAFRLEQQECPVANFAFDATTFYLAIDITVRWWIDDKTCEEPCIHYPNPICTQ